MVPHAVNTCRCLQKIETRKTAAAKKREQVSILRIVLEATFRGSHCSLSVIEEMNLQHHHTDSPDFEDGSGCEVIELRIVIKATCGVRRAASRRRHLRSMKLTVNETYGQPWGAWLFLQTCTGSKRGVASLQYCRLIELERFSLRRTWKHKQEKQTKSDVSTKQKMEVWGKNTRVQAKIRQRITHTITDYTIILAIVIVQFIHRSESVDGGLVSTTHHFFQFQL